jgi:hypothetical protein
MREGGLNDRSPLASAEITNGGATPPLSPTCIHGAVLNYTLGQLLLYFFSFTTHSTFPGEIYPTTDVPFHVFMLAANNKLWEELSAYPFTVE